MEKEKRARTKIKPITKILLCLIVVAILVGGFLLFNNFIKPMNSKSINSKLMNSKYYNIYFLNTLCCFLRVCLTIWMIVLALSFDWMSLKTVDWVLD